MGNVGSKRLDQPTRPSAAAFARPRPRFATEPDEEPALRPATDDELEFSLAHALQFNGRKQFRHAVGMMAQITAKHLIERLRISGYVIMKKPPTPHHTGGPMSSTNGDKGHLTD